VLGRSGWALRTVTRDADKIKPIETLLSHSLATFQITKASVGQSAADGSTVCVQLLGCRSELREAGGNLLLVRPRFIGNKSSDLLETKERENIR